MSDVPNGMAAAMAARPLPSLFAPGLRAQGHDDVRILDELSAGRGTGAGRGRVGMVLTLGVALVIVGVLVRVMWESGRAPAGEGAGGREPVDVVAMSAPVVTPARQERLLEAQALVMPPVQEFRAPAATIVEMSVQRVEPPKIVDSPTGGANAGRAGGRRPMEATGGGGARVAQREVARAPAVSAKSKSGGERKADARRGAPPVRTPPAIPKHVEERVDADVQVIEAIVTRAR